ncbi:MAG: coproporphyrinogen dehydrogenase, partial [Clostridia bacterium]|nr:coproporphyrinogen dehydrogenase [Clostridia bacterium]
SVTLPDEDTVNEMQRMAIARFEKAGLMRYEISNFAYPGCESRHNMAYWQDIDYLGLGCAAHSLMENRRFSNPAVLEDYISGARMLDLAERSVDDRKEEIIMLSTRMVAGLDIKKWRAEFNEDFEARYRKPIEKMQRYGLLEIENGFMKLTPAGMELQDAVVLEFLDA